MANEGSVHNESASEVLKPAKSPENGENAHTQEEAESKESPAPDVGLQGEGSTKESVIAEVTSVSGKHGSQSGREGSTPSVNSEKITEDGYNWRKYGQKNVKGNEFVRSYYRCTYPKCPVKKQVERSLNGQITDNIYLGQHSHPIPQMHLPVPVSFSVSIAEEKPEKLSSMSIEDKSSEAKSRPCPHVESKDTLQLLSLPATGEVKTVVSPKGKVQDEVDDDPPGSKRRKKDSCSTDTTLGDKLTNEARTVIQTVSEVDIVNDGYRWRKYGQKMVKGNPNPRSYYRCSSPGCPAKKHVERASHDAKVVMTTYEGQHDHGVPPARTVMHNSPGFNGTVATQIEDANVKSDDGKGASTVSGNKSADQTNGRVEETSRTGGPVDHKTEPDKDTCIEDKTNEQSNDLSGAKSGGSDPVSLDSVVNVMGENSRTQQQPPNTAAVQS